MRNDRDAAGITNDGIRLPITGNDRSPAPTIARLQHAHIMGKLVGSAAAFREIAERLPIIARAEATVLITGETGTGKELVARAIHYQSARERGPFTAVNCGSLPDTLLEDELFGHTRGAFTDAKSSRVGLLQRSHGGTLLLDEVDSLSPRAQVALLRVLQERSYRTLGSSEEQHIDVRVICASNVDLWELVERQEFRADLLYRLSVLTLHLPPLRERIADILPLTHHFLCKYLTGGRVVSLAPDAKAALLAHSWPGNVRELENAVLRAVSMTEHDTICAHDLGLRVRTPLSSPVVVADRDRRVVVDGQATTRVESYDLSRSFGDLKKDLLQRFEREYLLRLMSDCDGNVSFASRRAQKERRDFRRLLRKHCIEPRDYERVLPAREGGAARPHPEAPSPMAIPEPSRV